MTIAQKAKQLVELMAFTCAECDYEFKAKQCALIAVDEIINTLNYDIRDLDVRGSVLLDLIKYWQEVKQEIEKL